MALPTLEKSYEFIVNQSFGGEGVINDNRKGVLAVKNALIDGSFTVPWTVDYSCDSLTAGTPGDGIDRWIVFTDLDWAENDASSARSWIVINMSAGRQLLIECRGSGGSTTKHRKLRVMVSPGGLFTGGTTITRPTATDEQFLISNEEWLAAQTSAQPYKFHLIRSTDGETTILLGCHNNTTPLFFAECKVQDPVAGFSHPWGAVQPAGGNGFSGCDHGSLRDTQQFQMTTVVPAGVNFSGAWSSEGFLSDGIGQEMTLPNFFTNEWPLNPIGVACSNLVTGMGRHGRIADLFYTSTALQDGDTIEAVPASPTREWAVFGDLVVPWNGTVPLTS
jgi:hypothetical protein